MMPRVIEAFLLSGLGPSHGGAATRESPQDDPQQGGTLQCAARLGHRQGMQISHDPANGSDDDEPPAEKDEYVGGNGKEAG
jgi:hypothetical protein